MTPDTDREKEGELTPTLKVKRKGITLAYQDLLDAPAAVASLRGARPLASRPVWE